MKFSWIIITMIGLGIGFYSCGKKEDEKSSSTSNEAVGTLAITCGGVACIGTEGK